MRLTACRRCCRRQVTVVGPKLALDRGHAHQTIDVADTELTVHGDDRVRTFRRTPSP
jgi:hypothetical protein